MAQQTLSTTQKVPVAIPIHPAPSPFSAIDVDQATIPAFSGVDVDETVQAGPKSFLDQLHDMFGSYISDVNPLPAFAKAATETKTVLKKALEGKLKEAGGRGIHDLVDLAGGLGQAHDITFQRGMDAYKKGHVGEAVGHFMNWIVLGVGPMMDEAETQSMQGNWGTGVGKAAAVATNILAPGAISDNLLTTGSQAITNAQRAGLGATLQSPAAAASDVAQFADAAKIPITMGTRMGSDLAKTAQKGAGATSFLAERIEAARQAAQAQAAAAAGSRIADTIAPTPQTPLTAGAAVQNAAGDMGTAVAGAYGRTADIIENRIAPVPSSFYTAGGSQTGELHDVIDALRDQAKGHYEAVEQGAKAHAQEVVVGFEPSQMLTSAGEPAYQKPITRSINFPIDVTETSSNLRELHDTLKREWPIAQREASPGFQALDNLINSRAILSLEEAEDALGAIKAIARRTTGRSQGLARFVGGKLEVLIEKSLREADASHLLDELRAGRAATAKKYEVLDLLKQLGSEPVKAARKLTASGDINADLLKQVAAVAPGASQEMGRAMVSSLFKGMFENGQMNVTRAGSAGSKWAGIGDITKKILIPNEAVRKQIDAFFKMAGEHGETATPSINMRSEVRAFDALVQAGDANVGQLEALARVAPEIPALVGRAYFEDAMGRLFSSAGEISHAQAVLGEWMKLGPRTRRMLFGANEKNIGLFFRLASDESFVGNSSRTAFMSHVIGAIRGVSELATMSGGLLLHNPMAIAAPAAYEITAAGLMKMMWSPDAAKTIIDAMKLPTTAANAAGIASARVLNAAKRLGVPVTKVPATGAAMNMLKGPPAMPGIAGQPQQQQPPTAQTAQPTTVGRFQVTEQPEVR